MEWSAEDEEGVKNDEGATYNNSIKYGRQVEGWAEGG